MEREKERKAGEIYIQQRGCLRIVRRPLAFMMCHSDAFEGGEGDPADVVADVDIAPVAELLFDDDLGALVEREEVRTRAVG